LCAPGRPSITWPLAGAGGARRSCRAAFVTNSRGIAPAGQIGDLSLPVDGTLFARLTEAYESAGRDPS
jgi:hypothetical protein